MRCGFVQEHLGKEYKISRLCDLVNVHRSSYYRWRLTLEQKYLNDESEKELFTKINRIFLESKRSYGVPRVWRVLLRRGVSCSRRQVGYIMRKNKLISVHTRKKRKYISTTDSSKTNNPSANLLARKFTAKSVNEKWVGDVTFIGTPEGWLYLAVVIDLFSRKVVGFQLSKNNDAKLACDAFRMAVVRRQQPSQLLYHSDRGSIYSSNKFKDLLAENNITPSMSRKGNCWDNGVPRICRGGSKLLCERLHKR